MYDLGWKYRGRALLNIIFSSCSIFALFVEKSFYFSMFWSDLFRFHAPGIYDINEDVKCFHLSNECYIEIFCSSLKNVSLYNKLFYSRVGALELNFLIKFVEFARSWWIFKNNQLKNKIELKLENHILHIRAWNEEQWAHLS